MQRDYLISREFTRREWTIIQIILTASMSQDYMRELFLEDVKKIVNKVIMMDGKDEQV